MKLITQSRLFGILLVAAALPMDPGVALAASAASAALESAAPPGSVEARLQRIAEAVREGQEPPSSVGDDAISVVVVGPGGIGWNNGGWGNGGFANGGFYNGGFRNGGFYNGGFRNGGFGNGGFRNGGGAWRNGGGGSAWRNGGGGGFRNHW
jgi:rSAM-associated Gly-rich repeat protein